MKTLLNTLVEMMDYHEGTNKALEWYVGEAVRAGGEAFCHRDYVFIWEPFDPIDGEHRETVYVIFAGGDVRKLVEHGAELVRRGMKNVVWVRGYKRGSQEVQKHSLREWVRLAKVLNKI